MNTSDDEVTCTHTCAPIFVEEYDEEKVVNLDDVDEDFTPTLDFIFNDSSPISWEESYYHGIADKTLVGEMCVGGLHRVLSYIDLHRHIGDRVFIRATNPELPEDAQDLEQDIKLVLLEGTLVAEATAPCSSSENISHAEMLSLIAPLAHDHGLQVHAVGEGYNDSGDEGGESTFWTVDSSQKDFHSHTYTDSTTEPLDDAVFRHVRVTAPNEMSVKNLIEATQDIASLMRVFTGGKPSAMGVFNLVRSNHTGRIVGLKESSWFEIKHSLYQFSVHEKSNTPKSRVTHQKLEFAKDVASFANAGRDAVIVLGIDETTEGSPHKLTPQHVPPQFKKSCYDILDDRVYPPLEGVQIELSGGTGRQLVAIFIPAQSPSKMPFLVSGETIGDKYEGKVFSVVRRRGETKISLSPEEFHSQIQVGRAFLEHQGNSSLS